MVYQPLSYAGNFLRAGGLSHLQRSNQCILKSQATVQLTYWKSRICMYIYIKRDRQTGINKFQKLKKGESERRNGNSARLWPRSKRVQTPVVLIYSLLDNYPWEKDEPSYPYTHSLNSITAVHLKGWLWNYPQVNKQKFNEKKYFVQQIKYIFSTQCSFET